MHPPLSSSHLLLLALLSTISHTQSDLQLADYSPKDFSLGPVDYTAANEITPPEYYANTDLLLSSNSGGDETKCSQPYNPPRQRMRVRGNDPSPLFCPFKPMDQYDLKQQPDAPVGGQQHIDNSEAGQQFQLDGNNNNNNRPQPENDQKKGAWWQRILPDWLDLGRLVPGPLKPNRKTEELYYQESCSNGNSGPSVTVCAPADPLHAARLQVVIEWCRISTCDSPKPSSPPPFKDIYSWVIHMTRNVFFLSRS